MSKNEISPDETSENGSDADESRRSSNNVSLNSTGNWFRTIPKRIRKFISKASRQNRKEEILEHVIWDRPPAIPPYDEDLTLWYYNCSHEEMAMIRACAQMARYGWFWGAISRQTAQERLHGMPNGSFLVRKSQINVHNFTISFRTAGKTLHYRIEFLDGYWQTFSSKHISIVELIEDAMKKSKENVFCYVKHNSHLIPPFPVRLTNPVSHFPDISTLQNMCRLVIQKRVNISQMDQLPLPNKLISYCKEWETIYGEMQDVRIGNLV